MSQPDDMLSQLEHMHGKRHDAARRSAASAQQMRLQCLQRAETCRQSVAALAGESSQLVAEGLSREDVFARLRLLAVSRAHASELLLEADQQENDADKHALESQERTQTARIERRRQDKFALLRHRIAQERRRRREAVMEELAQEECACRSMEW